MTYFKHLRVSDGEDAVVIEFRDSRLSAELTLMAVGPELNEAAVQAAGRRLVLDFTGVEFLSSAMLGKVLMLARRAADAGGHVVICGLGPTLALMFDQTRLGLILDIRRNQQEALAASPREGEA